MPEIKTWSPTTLQLDQVWGGASGTCSVVTRFIFMMGFLHSILRICLEGFVPWSNTGLNKKANDVFSSLMMTFGFSYANFPLVFR
jgi:hypothetical protein